MGSKSESGASSAGSAGRESGAGGSGTTAAGARENIVGTDTGPDFADSGAAVSEGMEPVGLVAAGSERGRLLAEADAALASAPADAGGGVAPAEGSDSGGSWADITPSVVTVVSGVVLPQWDIKANEQTEVSTALAQCMDQVFPGGLDGKYACWVRLVMACGAITVSRAMQPGGLPPLFNNKRRAAAPASTPADPLTLTSLGV